MTNYRIGRIGTHRHASALNLTTSTRQNRGRGIKVQFHGVNIGQTTAGKVSKQMDSCRRSLSKSSNKYKCKCRMETVNVLTQSLTHCFMIVPHQNACRSTGAHATANSTKQPASVVYSPTCYELAARASGAQQWESLWTVLRRTRWSSVSYCSYKEWKAVVNSLVYN